MSHPRLLIVGTIPYNTKDSSRAFEAYFHNWEKENIAQIFSDPKTPVNRLSYAAEVERKKS